MLQLPPLPYDYNALEPFLSKEQVKVHYEQHHSGYYQRLNSLAESTGDLSLEAIITQFDARNENVFNNAAQAYNHDLFWQCLSPNGGGLPSGNLLEAIVNRFGCFDLFKSKFIFAATNLFGSGWCWLIIDNSGKMEIQTTQNANCPMSDKSFPIFTVDVWEHSYYLDYHSKRAEYLERFWTKINWHFIERRFQKGTNNK